MLNWIRIIIIFISGILVGLCFIFAPKYVLVNGIKMKYNPINFTTWESYLKEQTESWKNSILTDTTFRKQPLKVRIRVAKNYYLQKIATKPDVQIQPNEIKEILENYFISTAKVINIYTFREMYPEYDDLSNDQIKYVLYERDYEKDMSQKEFEEYFFYNFSKLKTNEMIRIADPHKNLIPLKDVTAIVIYSIGILIIAATLYFLTYLLERKRNDFDFNDIEIDVNEYSKNEKYYAEILGLNGKINKADIRKIYHELVMKYHPDRVEHLGIEFQRLAEQKLKEINSAYSFFKKKYNL